MPYWDHKGETQGIASPLCGSYNKGKMPGLSLRWTGLFSFMCPPPSHVTATGGMGKRLGKTLPLKVGQVQDHVLKKRNYLLVD